MFNKFILFLLASVMLVSAESVTAVYSYEMPKVLGNYTYLEGCQPNMQGFAPAVSVQPCLIMLKPGHRAVNASVSYGELKKVPGTHFIKPVVPAYDSEGNNLGLTAETIYRDAEARSLMAQYYEKDELYPGVKETYPVVTQHKYGVPVAITITSPVQYNPVRNELFYYENITVTVETEPADPTADLAEYVMTPFHRSIMQFTVDNPQQVADLKLTPKDDDDYEVLVITHPTVKEKFNEYVAFNKRRGLRTKVALIADVLQTSGPSNQDKIRNYIKNEYDNHKIVFAVLGGDINQINHRELYSEFYDHNHTPDRFNQKYSGADLYYGTLDGDWNKNGNDKYGEPEEEDLLWEVFVSRLPVDNVTQLDNILKKTMQYAEQPHGDQVLNVLMAGEFLWDKYGKTIWGADNMEYYVGHKTAYGWETYGWPENFDLDWLTDRESGAAHAWGPNDLKSKILSHRPSWIDHDGHANSTYCYTVYSNQIAGTFTNSGDQQNYFITVSGGCNPGQFKVNDCFMERLTYHSSGAVATIGNWDSGIGDDDDNNSPSGVPTRHLHDVMFNPRKRVHFLEATHALGKEAIIAVAIHPTGIDIPPYYGLMRYVCYNTNLLGDPALSVWTRIPKEVNASTFEYSTGEDAFMMDTPPYTCIALASTENDEIFAAAISGYQYNIDANTMAGDSTCVINEQAYKDYAADNDSVKVYIKAHNYLPASFTLPVGHTGTITQGNRGIIHNYSVTSLRNNTILNFAIETDEIVNVSLFNAKGACVKELLNKRLRKGANHRIIIDNKKLGCGFYYCRLSAGNTRSVKSLAIMK